ncbi:MAG: hypothetical protein JNK81_00530 [Anaerolineales bacterium]|nr:hypothetical protein [Anaerolineales bacterium]
MNKKPKTIFAFLSLLLIMSLACGTFGTTPTDSDPVDFATEESNQSQPTAVPATPTKIPTNTPRPTNTPVPPTATAAPIGVPSSNSDYEVTVLYARYFGKVFSGGFEYTPLTYGGQFLDVGILIKNLQPDTQRNIPWQNVYIVIEKTNESFYPNFSGSFVPSNDAKFDPATLFLYPEDTFENIVFDDIVYLRGVWATDGSKPATYYFGFDASPLIEVVID